MDKILGHTTDEYGLVIFSTLCEAAPKSFTIWDLLLGRAQKQIADYFKEKGMMASLVSELASTCTQPQQSRCFVSMTGC